MSIQSDEFSDFVDRKYRDAMQERIDWNECTECFEFWFARNETFIVEEFKQHRKNPL